MKEGWEYSSIGDLCDKMNGLWKGKTGPFVNVGVIRNANFTKSFTLSFDNIEYLDVEAKQYKTRKLQKGDLIVEKSGGSEKQPVGRTVLFDREDGDYSFSNFTSVLRIKDRDVISPEFLYKYILFVYLRGDTRKMQKATTGIHNIEFDKFLSIPVPKISLSEQQSIVDYLDSAFAKIDAMKANAEKALNEAKALFQASLKEMLEPKEGWEYKKLDDICTIVGRIGFRGYTKADLVDSPNDGAITLSPSNITNGELDFSKCTYISWDKYNESPEIMLTKGDVVLVKTASIGKCAVVKELPHKATLNPQFVVLKGIIGEPNFIGYYLKSPVAQITIKQMAGGVAIPTLSQKKLGTMLIPSPSLSEQQSIVATLDSLKSKVDKLQANYEKISQECDALKQAILRQVFE